MTEVVVREETRKLGMERAGAQQEKKGRKTNSGKGKFQEEVGTAWHTLESIK